MKPQVQHPRTIGVDSETCSGTRIVSDQSDIFRRVAWGSVPKADRPISIAEILSRVVGDFKERISARIKKERRGLIADGSTGKANARSIVGGSVLIACRIVAFARRQFEFVVTCKPRHNVQRVVPRCLHLRRENHGGIDDTDDVFKLPVAAEFGMSCQVIAGRNVRARQGCNRVDELLAGIGFGEVTAVEQDVRVAR